MAYNVKLDVFEGPLDLLLHLIRDNEMDIYDISIADITEQYMKHLDLMKTLNLEIVGDYLVMASTLTYIKSRSLLPKHELEEEDDEDGIDPRDELIRKLIEYKKFKEAASELRERELAQSDIFTRTPSDDDEPDESELLVEIGVMALISSFNKVLERFGGGGSEYTVTLEEMSIADKLNEIMGRLEEVDNITFDSLFEYDKSKMDVIATFMALLEIIKLKLARAHQSRMGGEIIIYRSIENGSDPGEADDEENPED